eukprot:CAMPEP_0194266176 /NCGR_PEP_ID=MMETSP0169-20130528/1170_1 /TAXON_ID=218684 /ORGANISM="Corethron pennatum, Strain L29A3" /LENGTH=129 /DNA_ID=CAMNT_0039006803 /DNA_START=208 /DNA_END=597 /DNA_ORIENTATION=+
MKLIKFLQRLTGETVTIELKNGTVIVGTVVGIDASMNAHLRKVKMTLKGKNPNPYATLSVRGSTVRAILLPESLNLDALLVDAADSGKPKNINVNRVGLAPSGRGRGRGRGRGGGGGGGGFRGGGRGRR